MKNRLAGLKRWKKILLGYAVLLLLSHLLTGIIDQPIQPDGQADKSVKLNAVKGDSILAGPKVDIYYRDIYSGSDPEPPTLLLLPGGPEGADVFNELARELSTRYRLIIPHLRTNQEREEDLPDYSFQAMAGYAHQLLNHLDISKAHVLGYGLGGASAIYLSHDYASKVQSVSLVSSIGVQELELLGSYRLNHAVHGIELGTVWLLQNAVPHFGLLDLIGINVSYAKSHYESDQRPLRGYLKQYKKPMLILHGRDDVLVPLAVAKEHHRIVPQSKMKVFDAGHDLIEAQSDTVGKTLSRFISTVQEGEAKWADDASPQRIREAQEPFSNVKFQKFTGVTLLIIMLIIMVGTFVSEDLTCIGAGLLAARGLIGFWPATAACFIGIFVGDIGLYMAGRVLGRPAVRRAPFKWFISEKDLTKSAHWFEARGPAIIIASRFLPGSRLPTYFSAGVIGASFLMFTVYFLLAAIIWTPMLVGISKLLGNELLRYFAIYHEYAIWVFIGGVIFLIMLVKLILPIFSYRGRRFLVSRYRRFTRWEYWSPFIIYGPIFIYILYLAVKYRCLTLFTATNPAIPDSGFVGESKTGILNLFEDRHVAQYGTIAYDSEYEQMLHKAEQFMESHDLTFPVVLKPDVGERGKGVNIVRNHPSMQEYLAEAEEDVIIQEFVEGEEYGIFYYRYPGESKGHIFSITTTELLYVVGDGERTLEELILEDKEAVSLAKHHLEQNEEHLFDIPDPGERVPIVELGTHARGAIFGDGEELITEALVNKMNEISNAVDGFHFGRFDLKAPSAQKLKEGEGLKIIEVNGVTSESTNIYDSQYSFFDAERILMNQWKLAYDIGEQNSKRGVEVTPLLPFLKRLFKELTKG